jgi:hypothetical protein
MQGTPLSQLLSGLPSLEDSQEWLGKQLGDTNQWLTRRTIRVQLRPELELKAEQLIRQLVPRRPEAMEATRLQRALDALTTFRGLPRMENYGTFDRAEAELMAAISGTVSEGLNLHIANHFHMLVYCCQWVPCANSLHALLKCTCIVGTMLTSTRCAHSCWLMQTCCTTAD